MTTTTKYRSIVNEALSFPSMKPCGFSWEIVLDAALDRSVASGSARTKAAAERQAAAALKCAVRDQPQPKPKVTGDEFRARMQAKLAATRASR